MSITPYRPKKDIPPYHVTTLDIETATDGTVLGIGFAWEDTDLLRHYRAYPGWNEWYEDYTRIYKDADKETSTRLQYIYAHNGAGFDWLSLIVWAEKLDLMQKMEFITTGGIGIGIDIEFPHSVTVHLRDSVRLMPGTLKSLCSSFGVETGKLDVPDGYISHMQDFKREFPKEFWAYLKNDVLALQEVVKSFWVSIYEKVGTIERLPLTLPSLAMRLWRMTLEGDILVSQNKRLKKLERDSYTGGRTECYMVGVYPVTVYDINSLYPSQMAAQLFPASYRGGWVKEYKGQPGIYRIAYRQTNQQRKPVLRDLETNNFLYEGSGVYTQPEIEKLIEIGGTVTLIEGYQYYDMKPLFKSFIDDWYGTRLEAQKQNLTGLAYVCKILMNSLYGKFGQKEEGEKLVLWDATRQKEELGKGTKYKLSGEFCIVTEHRKSETTFVAVASYVTAYGRLRDYEAMELAEDLGGMVTYTDTDSQHVYGAELPTGTALGENKEEFRGRIAYLGKKLYAKEKGEVKAKGIGKDARAKMSFDLFAELAETGRDYSATFITFPSILETVTGARPANRAFTRTRTIRRAPSLRFTAESSTMQAD